MPPVVDVVLPGKPLVPAVPGKVNNGDTSVLEELDELPEINEPIVCVMAYST